MKKIVMMALALTAFTGMSANAATFSYLGGNDIALPASWDDFDVGSAPVSTDTVRLFTGLDIGAGVTLNHTSKLRYEYLGKEAGNINQSFSLGLDSGGSFNTDTSEVGDYYYRTQYITGLQKLLDLNFLSIQFLTDGSVAGTEGGFVNGAGSLMGLSMAAFIETGGNSVVLMLGDGAGDNDYDDMFVRVSAVPLPAAFWLFGSGLVGLFGMRKRAKAKLA